MALRASVEATRGPVYSDATFWRPSAEVSGILCRFDNRRLGLQQRFQSTAIPAPSTEGAANGPSGECRSDTGTRLLGCYISAPQRRHVAGILCRFDNCRLGLQQRFQSTAIPAPSTEVAANGPSGECRSDSGTRLLGCYISAPQRRGVSGCQRGRRQARLYSLIIPCCLANSWRRS
jgi:hypothetical protein